MSRIAVAFCVAATLTVPARAVPVETNEAGAAVQHDLTATGDLRAGAEAVTAGVHEEGLPTPPLSLVLAAATLGGVLMLSRRDRRSPWS
ncbi:MAG: hypothetical protein ACFBWO_01070 [Paracoccaceae bacterium]